MPRSCGQSSSAPPIAVPCRPAPSPAAPCLPAFARHPASPRPRLPAAQLARRRVSPPPSRFAIVALAAQHRPSPPHVAVVRPPLPCVAPLPRAVPHRLTPRSTVPRRPVSPPSPRAVPRHPAPSCAVRLWTRWPRLCGSAPARFGLARLELQGLCQLVKPSEKELFLATESGAASVFTSLAPAELAAALSVRNEDGRSLIHVATASDHPKVSAATSPRDDPPNLLGLWV
ncbi:hypothetical protein ZWY2020_039569 [Hordeum vulgare]|nr:hypothetical protein ZWY2020_039569 [Hordeum vulgare]